MLPLRAVAPHLLRTPPFLPPSWRLAAAPPPVVVIEAGAVTAGVCWRKSLVGGEGGPLCSYVSLHLCYGELSVSGTACRYM